MEIYKVNTGFIYLKDKHLDKPNIPPDLKKIFTDGYPANFFVIKNNNKKIIIDAGLSANLKYPLGRFFEKSFFNVETKKNVMLDEINNSDIFFTHLHSDHTGYLKDFSRVKTNRIITNKDEYNQSKKFFSFIHGYKRNMIKKVKFDFIEINTFNKSVSPFLYNDFYNDSTLIILSTPGHARGHVSLLLKYKKYKLLFTGDLIRGFHEFKYPMRYFNYSSTILSESLNVLKYWVKSDKDLILIFGHNKEQDEIIGDNNLINRLDKLIAYQDYYKKKYMIGT